VQRAGILITGTVGVGKSTMAARVGAVLQARGIAHAVIDLDEIRRFWPKPADDPFGLQVELQNLEVVATTYWAAGAKQLVLAGVCESREDRKRYEQAIAVPLAVCRLRACPTVIDQRLRRRHADEPAALHWHLNRAGELDAILDHADVADHTIWSGCKPPDEIVAEILQLAARRMS
jgi:predicted kinase